MGAAGDGKSRPLVVFVGPPSPARSSLVEALDRLGAIRLQQIWTTQPAKRKEVRQPDRMVISEALLGDALATNRLLGVVSIAGTPYHTAVPHFVRSDDGRIDSVAVSASMVDDLRASVGGVLVYLIQSSESHLREHLLAGQRGRDRGVERAAAYLEELDHAGEIADRTFAEADGGDRLVARVVEALREDLGEAIPLGDPLVAMPAPTPGLSASELRSRRRGRGLRILGMTLSIGLLVIGLGALAVVALFLFMLNAWGSNK